MANNRFSLKTLLTAVCQVTGIKLSNFTQLYLISFNFDVMVQKGYRYCFQMTVTESKGKYSRDCNYRLLMPKYWGKQIFAHGRFPEVGQKQKTERKTKEKKKKSERW